MNFTVKNKLFISFATILCIILAYKAVTVAYEEPVMNLKSDDIINVD